MKRTYHLSIISRKPHKSGVLSSLHSQIFLDGDAVAAKETLETSQVLGVTTPKGSCWLNFKDNILKSVSVFSQEPDLETIKDIETALDISLVEGIRQRR